MAALDKFLTFQGFNHLKPAGQLNNGVSEAFAKTEPVSSNLDEIFLYLVPETTDDGACAASEKIAAEPFDLGQELFGTKEWRNIAATDRRTQTILQLRQVVKHVQALTGVDWLGVYKLVEQDGRRYLVKLAYHGRLSRAIFPLNDLFHDISNNSWVAMEGTPKLIQDVKTYDGPYYACDQQVQSELCSPIFHQDGHVIGIIDAESFQPQFFDDQKILEIFKTCADLGNINLGFS